MYHPTPPHPPFKCNELPRPEHWYPLPQRDVFLEIHKLRTESTEREKRSAAPPSPALFSPRPAPPRPAPHPPGRLTPRPLPPSSSVLSSSSSSSSSHPPLRTRTWNPSKETPNGCKRPNLTASPLLHQELLWDVGLVDGLLLEHSLARCGLVLKLVLPELQHSYQPTALVVGSESAATHMCDVFGVR